MLLSILCVYMVLFFSTFCFSISAGTVLSGRSTFRCLWEPVAMSTRPGFLLKGPRFLHLDPAEFQVLGMVRNLVYTSACSAYFYFTAAAPPPHRTGAAALYDR